MYGRRAAGLPLLAILASACDDGPGADASHDAGDDAAAAGDAAAAFDGGRADDRGSTATRLHIRVLDAKTRARLPAMVSLFPVAGGNRLRFGNFADPDTAGMGTTAYEVGMGGALLTWHGIAVWRGEAVVPVGVDFDIRGHEVVDRKIPHGRYRLVANRGVEYDLSEAEVDLAPGRGAVFVELLLPRVVDTSGYVAADMHVHSVSSGDSRLSEKDRVKSMAIAGVEVVVASDHDYNTDLSEAVRALWPQPGDAPPLTAVPGNEASYTDVAHFNVFPVVVDRSRPKQGAVAPPDGGTPSQSFFDGLRALPGRPVVQLNHTRLGFPAYFDNGRCGPWLDRRTFPPCSLDFDAMEVLSGYLTCGTKIEAQMNDWYALLGFGILVTATGASDTHGTSRLLGGFPRTYVRIPDDRPEAVRPDDFVTAVRERRAIATSGPFLTLRVNDSREEGALMTETAGRVTAKMRMQAASWVVVDEVRLRVNGDVVKSWPVPRIGVATPFFEVAGEIVETPADAFITAEAYGRKSLPPFVVGEWTEIARLGQGGVTGPFNCPASPGAEQGMAVFAVTNPVFVDADGDGRFRGPRQPAVFPKPTR